MTRLEEIKARADAATPGPWDNETDWEYVCPSNEGEDAPPICGDCNRRDSTFIAHARADIPWLLESVKDLIREVNDKT